jgi:hypothetical protein
MIKSSLIKVLHKIHNKLNINEVNWAVTGSLGLALHGMDIEVHDIDIQTDKSGAYEIEHRFLSYVVRNIEFSSSEKIRSYFGELNVDGIKVEIMGDIQKRLPDETWENKIDVRHKRCFINYHGLSIPVMSLEYECQAYYKLGRTEKADQIRRYLEQRSEVLRPN